MRGIKGEGGGGERRERGGVGRGEQGREGGGKVKLAWKGGERWENKQEMGKAMKREYMGGGGNSDRA